MNRIAIKRNRLYFSLMLFCSFGFVAAGLFLVSYDSDPQAKQAGWCGILFFGACAVVFCAQLLDSRPRLVIDDTGICDRSLGIGTIPWSEIAGAYVKSTKNQVFVCLELRDESKFTSNLNPVAQALKSTNVRLGFTSISLPITGLDVNPEQLCELIQKKSMEQIAINSDDSIDAQREAREHRAIGEEE